MAVFITGGFGHLGSWMARYLALGGTKVLLYDLQEKPLDYLEDVSDSIQFIRGDISDFPRLIEVFRQYGEQIEGIVHTVGVMGEFVAENPHRNVQINVMGTLNVLELARQFSIRKVLYISTGAVYGAIQGIAAELEDPPAPADLYAASKTSSEFLGLQYARSFDFDFRVGRVYFIYGPGKRPSSFVRLYRIAFGALEGKLEKDAGQGGDQKLDFTYVEDAARGLVLLYRAEKPEHQIYNIATGFSTSVAQVAELTRRYAPADIQLNIGPGTLMPRCEALDITLARKDLGFEPEVDLKEGLKRYAAWLRELEQSTNSTNGGRDE